ncbi:esterase/lipase family protein [Variovorax ginsengisoli]|uniref:DUF676 domain-containing protein n=1 Tax=Variovorax ginsengisoli TaxID=363844 RepID=A0ABT8SBY5_9BURK|nr:hypothetical protein [Variovorax ginsengisoli]MDN8617258.1 hypothetical protein [Variovorax ginsengisoli]MDO1536428.1 hypothetical protein [Variovorax ginsengisoli]
MATAEAAVEALSTAKRYPIIYVRGFAFSASERDETAADPYCGFNVGSTVARATADKNRPQSYFFESPIVRLSLDHKYEVMYTDGIQILDPTWSNGPMGQARVDKGIPMNSIIIHRFYDAGSNLVGSGKSSSISDYAKELAKLIATVRLLVRNHESHKDGCTYTDADFRCYLVAHSMGGLIVRALLQNKANDVSKILVSDGEVKVAPVRDTVAKVFTYATPHNGIELGGFNVPRVLPGFLKDASTFNRDVMRAYLDKQLIGGNINYLPEDISPPPSHWFCMVGTNRLDYEVAAGLSRNFVGRGSDGLVRIDNATLWYQEKVGDGEDAPLIAKPTATAYAYRSHSGSFGIVNSEEAYQNLVRFLFGNFRIDLWLDIENATLPAIVQQQEDAGRRVDAVYQIELTVGTRGKTWALSRRKSEDDSPACRTYQDLKKLKAGQVESVHLSTVFLIKSAKVNSDRPGISYSVTLGIRAPDYEVDKAFWPDGHYEGVQLFRDSLVVTLYDPADYKKLLLSQGNAAAPPEGHWMVSYDWLEDKLPPDKRSWSQEFSPEAIAKPMPVLIDLHQPAPGTVAQNGSVKARLRMVASGWE